MCRCRCRPERRRAAIWAVRQEAWTGPIEVRDRAVVNEAPAAVDERIGIYELRLADGRPANVRQHMARKDSRRRWSEVLPDIRRQGLPFDVRTPSS